MSKTRLMQACGGVALAAGIGGFASNADASLTIDLRPTDGSKEIVANPGDKLLIEIWAIVDGTSTDLTNSYGFQAASGSIVSQGSLRGDLSGKKGDLDMYQKTPAITTALRPFARAAEQPGVPVDLDGDGDLDLGAPNQDSAAGFIIVRSDPMEYFGLSNAVVPGPDDSSIQAKIGRVEFTVGSTGDRAELLWMPRRNAAGQIAAEAGLWFDDQGGTPGTRSGTTGTIAAAAPLVVLVPEPGVLGTLALGAVGLLARRRK
jgi:hypothetical protein